MVNNYFIIINDNVMLIFAFNLAKFGTVKEIHL